MCVFAEGLGKKKFKKKMNRFFSFSLFNIIIDNDEDKDNNDDDVESISRSFSFSNSSGNDSDNDLISFPLLRVNRVFVRDSVYVCTCAYASVYIVLLGHCHHLC